MKRKTAQRSAAALLSVLAAAAAVAVASGPARAQMSGVDAKARLVDAIDNPELNFEAIAQTARSNRARAAVETCRKGSAKACYELGDMIHGGDGITRDNELAVALIDRGCQEGYERACYDMGVRFHLGVVVDQDLHTARAYFQHACSAGMAVGCHMLGVAARDGVGVDVDTDLAERYFERSCTLGYQPDCALASWPVDHDAGRWESGLPADASADVVDQARICDGGLMSGCVALAEAYTDGQGVSQDMQQAYELYEWACDWGALDACAVYRAWDE